MGSVSTFRFMLYIGGALWLWLNGYGIIDSIFWVFKLGAWIAQYMVTH